MLNREKFATEILNIVCDGEDVAVVDGKPRRCAVTPCDTCVLHGNCTKRFKHWANSEYVEPSVDWSKVPIDTRVLVRDRKEEEWKRAHFAGYDEKRGVRTWPCGTTSWSEESYNSLEPVAWNYAKLAESEGQHGEINDK